MPAPRIHGKLVSPRMQRILSEICVSAGIASCRVSSVGRTPRQQAEAMYGLIVRNGPAAVRALYKAPGKSVVDVYVAHQGESRAAILAAMLAKINEVGPERVSAHCSKTREVVDIAPSSIPGDKLEAFVSAALSHPEVLRVLSPITEPRDPEAIHIESDIESDIESGIESEKA